eukprot:jgi/Bigna1/70840/fgenesh1_pg.13_\
MRSRDQGFRMGGHWIVKVGVVLFCFAVTSVTAKDQECHPQCRWMCDDPQCPALCHPICEKPKCEMSCEQVPCAKCKVHCEKPICSIRCPKDMCERADCPKCETVCAPAKCFSTCTAPEAVCTPVCEETACQWKRRVPPATHPTHRCLSFLCCFHGLSPQFCQCRKPKTCPKPKCTLQCQKPTCEMQTFAGGSNGDGCCECAMSPNAMMAIELANGISGHGNRSALAAEGNMGIVNATTASSPSTTEFPSFLEVMDHMRHLQGDMCCPCAPAPSSARAGSPLAAHSQQQQIMPPVQFH